MAASLLRLEPDRRRTSGAPAGDAGGRGHPGAYPCQRTRSRGRLTPGAERQAAPGGSARTEAGPRRTPGRGAEARPARRLGPDKRPGRAKRQGGGAEARPARPGVASPAGRAVRPCAPLHDHI